MLTPDRIKEKTFQTSGRGSYRAEDVDSFFREVSASYEQMFKENTDLIKKISVFAKKIEEYRADEDSLKMALLNAQKLADKIVAEAKETAANEVASVKSETDQLRAEAASDAAALELNAKNESETMLASAKKESAELLANAKAEALLAGLKQLGKVKLLAARVDMRADQARALSDTVKDKYSDAVAVLAVVNDGKLNLIVAAGADAVKAGAHAGNLLREVAAICGGKGGGRPDSAMGGGKDIDKIPEALAKAEEILANI
jgi:alanyl-tRNA synthetase